MSILRKVGSLGWYSTCLTPASCRGVCVISMIAVGRGAFGYWIGKHAHVFNQIHHITTHKSVLTGISFMIAHLKDTLSLSERVQFSTCVHATARIRSRRRENIDWEWSYANALPLKTIFPPRPAKPICVRPKLALTHTHTRMYPRFVQIVSLLYPENTTENIPVAFSCHHQHIHANTFWL